MATPSHSTADAWTRWYWPAAAFVSVAAFLAVPAAWRGTTLAVGTALIVVPELIALAVLRKPADTFSDWVWNVLKITRSQPVTRWSAAHVLTAGLYLALATRVLIYLWGHGGHIIAGTATVVAAWLLFHFFAGWWR